MLLKKILIRFLMKLAKKFKLLFKYSKHKYHIADIMQSESSDYKVLIVIADYGTTRIYNLADIIASKNMLDHLSPQDLIRIIKLRSDFVYCPQYRIMTQEMCEQFNNILFKIKNYANQEFLIHSANQIFLNKKLLYNFSKEEMCSIAYTAGYEKATCEEVQD